MPAISGQPPRLFKTADRQDFEESGRHQQELNAGPPVRLAPLYGLSVQLGVVQPNAAGLEALLRTVPGLGNFAAGVRPKQDLRMRMAPKYMPKMRP